MFYENFFSQQVKRCAINTYKHAIYEFPNKLPNGKRLRILGNKEISGKSQNQNPMEVSPVNSPPTKMNILSILAKHSWKKKIKLFP